MIRNGRRKVIRPRLRQDKGHRNEVQTYIRQISSGENSIIPIDEIVSTTKCTIAMARTFHGGNSIKVLLSTTEQSSIETFR